MQRPQENPRRLLLKRERARELRSNTTEPERKLWAILRRKQMNDVRFRRQQPIGPYVVDFYCPAAKLIIELDGEHHGEKRHVLYDEARTRWLAANGYRMLRFANSEFLRHRQSVLDCIWRAVEIRDPPLPDPAPRQALRRIDPPSRGG